MFYLSRKYSQTPLYVHQPDTHSFPFPWEKKALKFPLNSTRLKQTSRSYGRFLWPQSIRVYEVWFDLKNASLPINKANIERQGITLAEFTLLLTLTLIYTYFDKGCFGIWSLKRRKQCNALLEWPLNNGFKDQSTIPTTTFIEIGVYRHRWSKCSKRCNVTTRRSTWNLNILTSFLWSWTIIVAIIIIITLFV